jgi:general L-amino acid transport system permease protein
MTTAAPEILPPPVERYTVLHWLKNNLFQNWFSGLVTVVLSILLLAVGRALLSWVLFEAQWQVNGENMKLLMVGQ